MIYSSLIATWVIALVSVTSSAAMAGTTLKQVQVTDGSQVDLLFDSKISISQVQTEFFNDTIQISLKDVSVYPAKISSVNGGIVTKIFAYQYAPKLVRCRLSVKGKADSYKNAVNVIPSGPGGRMLTIRIGSAEKDQLTVQSAKAETVVKTIAPPLPANEADENALLQRVLKAPVAEARPTNSGEKSSESLGQSESRPLAGGKPLPSPLNAFWKLGVVLALFGAIAWAASKLRKGGKSEAKLMGALGRFAKNGLGKKGKMIEVVSTHYLGPKKSIAVVRISGRLLVLGVTNESINLITDMGSEGAEAPESAEDFMSDGLGATAAGPAAFADIFKSETVRPAPVMDKVILSSRAPAAAAQASSLSPNVRARIRSRMEGLKPL